MPPPIPSSFDSNERSSSNSRMKHTVGSPLVDRSEASGMSLGSRRARLLPFFHATADIGCWIGALVVAALLRYGRIPAPIPAVDLILLMGITAVAHLAVGFGLGLYRRRWQYGSFEEVLALTASFGGTAVLVIAYLTAFGQRTDQFEISRTVPAIGAGAALLAALAGRSVWRVIQGRSNRPDQARRAIIVGAGDGGTRLIQALLANPDAPFLPVAFVDDDAHKVRLRIHGVPVAGAVADLAGVAERHHAAAVVIAAPSISKQLARSVDHVLSAGGASHQLAVHTMPSLNELLESGTNISAIRPINEGDLIGRDPAPIDPTEIAHHIAGKVVAVTGAGGSIGSELCRQLAQFAPRRLVMIDRDESGLHATQLSVDGRGMLDSADLVLLDLRDHARVSAVIAEVRPEVIFHAAALKHLPLLEAHPTEAWKTNVEATHHLLATAADHDVSVFVNISTDKAADPSSILGYTKRLTERLTADIGRRSASRFLSVRFGNVLKSRGSVLTAFEHQVANGGPITVTHPDVERYFMTVEEAARLTIFGVTVGDSGDILVLDMGEPVKIFDVARKFAERQDPPMDITITGLRSGEKLSEVLFSQCETDIRRVHPAISHVAAPPLDFTTCMEATANGTLVDAGTLRELTLRGIGPLNDLTVQQRP